MSGFPTRLDSGGITSQQTTTIANLVLGEGAFKTAILANEARPSKEEFTYAGLQSAGGPGNYYYGYYAIVAVADFPADRLLSEFVLQFEFAKMGLSPNIYALKINNDIPLYGETNINKALTAKAGEKCNFLIVMERINYKPQAANPVTRPSDIINAKNGPEKLLELIGKVLSKRVLLTDVKLANLCVKCTGPNTCVLGVIDLDDTFVSGVTSWYFFSELGITSDIHVILAKQYMVLMVCFVGLTNGLNKDTKIELLTKVGLLSQNGQTYTFNTDAINNMLRHPALKSQIMHYLVGKYSHTDVAAKEINNEFILAELFDIATRDSSNLYSSSSGGKSRRKHKKTRRRRPKSKKTRRIHSLRNHNLTR